MGKIKSEIPRGHYVFRNAPNAKGERALNLQYVCNGVPVYKSTGIFLHPDMWNAATQEARAKCPDATRINRRLKEFRNNIDEQIENCDEVVTVEVLRSIIKGTYGQTGKDTPFIQYAVKLNETRYQQGKIGYSTYYNASLSLQHFRRYFLENNIPEPRVSNITIGMVDGFKEWNLTSAKMKSKEAINKKLTPIIKAARYAADNGLLDAKTATAIAESYLDTKTRKYEGETEEKDVRYLDEAQMNRIKELYGTIHDVRRLRILDIFLFAYYACGLRVSDIITLEWNHINFDDRVLIKQIVKTKNTLRIPLCDEANNILRKYQHENKNPRFVFNCLPVDFNLDDPARLDTCLKSNNRNFQTSLRTIGKKLGLPFNLTMHVARHSFAVQALNNGMDVHVISTLLGHTSITATEKVYAKFLNKTLDQALIDKMPFSFTGQSNS